jgi:hypothetical protein
MLTLTLCGGSAPHVMKPQASSEKNFKDFKEFDF